MDSTVIKECMLSHPDAASEVEAVDMEAQRVYKELQDEFGVVGLDKLQKKITLYNYLRELRAYLNNKRVEELSSFTRIGN